MNTWIALLRGVNVGGKHIVPMKELRTLLSENGFENVQTYIQSGNIVYRKKSPSGDQLASLVDTQFGFRPAVFTLSIDALRDAAANNPFHTDIGKTVHFTFIEGDTSSMDSELLESLKAPSEQYALNGQVFYLHAPDGIGRSKLVAKIDRIFKGCTLTARNLNTINKLLAMIEE